MCREHPLVNDFPVVHPEQVASDFIKDIFNRDPRLRGDAQKPIVALLLGFWQLSTVMSFTNFSKGHKMLPDSFVTRGDRRIMIRKIDLVFSVLFFCDQNKH